MVRIVLINPPAPFLAFPNAGPHLGMGYLASYLRQVGIEVSYLNLEMADPAAVSVPEGYDFYGLTAVTPQYFFAKRLRDEIAKRRLGRTIIGGAHASLMPNQCLQDGFDFVVCGYGEVSLANIIAGRCEPGIIQGQVVMDLDSLPFPAWDDLTVNYNVSWGHKTAHMFTLRGCPYGCFYCCSPRIYGCTVRYRSIENVVSEAKFLIERFGVDSLYFFDPTFTLNQKRAAALAQRLGELGISWTCQTRVDCIDPELLRLMYRCGCNQISFGIETGSVASYVELGKMATVDQNADAIRMAHDAGMRVKTFLMGALPEDSLRTAEAFKSFLLRNRPDNWLYSTFIPFPGTDYWKEPERFGIEILCRDFRAYYPLGLNARGPINTRNRFLSRDELRQLRDEMLEFLRREFPNPRVEEAIRLFDAQKKIFLPYLDGLDLEYMF